MTVTALIVAAGKGERLGGDVPKQYRPIGGKPVLRWAVEAWRAIRRSTRCAWSSAGPATSWRAMRWRVSTSAT